MKKQNQAIQPEEPPFRVYFTFFSIRNFLFAYFAVLIIGMLPFKTQTPVLVQLLTFSLAAIFFGCYSRISNQPLFDKTAYSESAKQASQASYIINDLLYGLTLLYYIINHTEYSDYLYVLRIPVLILGYIATANQMAAQLEGTAGATQPYTLVISSLKVKFNKYDIISSIVAITPIAAFVFTEHWLLNNIIAFSITIYSIKKLRLSRPLVCIGVLLSYLLYDVLVLRNKENPISAVLHCADLPLKLHLPGGFAEDLKLHSILGIEDIIIPGCFVAQCLEIDVDRIIQHFYIKKQVKTKQDPVLFHWAFLGYLFGIITAYEILVRTRIPQPVFMYIVPFCIISLLFACFYYRAFRYVFSYNLATEKSLQHQFFIENAVKQKKN